MARLPLVSPLDRILFLKAQPYLETQPFEVVTALASYTEERFYRAGSMIRSRGERVREVLFLAEGEVEIRFGPGFPMRRVTAPGVVGLSHYFAAHSPTLARAGSGSATDAAHPSEAAIEVAPAVRARADTLCLAIGADDLEQLLEDHFTLMLQFAYRTGEEAHRNRIALGPDRPPEPGFEAAERDRTPVDLDLVQRLARVRRAPFFRRTNLTVLGELIRDQRIERLMPGEALWQRGDPIDGLALVIDGHFQSTGTEAPCDAPAGAVLGALEILCEDDRREGWSATTPSRVLAMPRDVFIDRLEDHSEFALDYLGYCARAATEAWRLGVEVRRRARRGEPGDEAPLDAVRAAP